VKKLLLPIILVFVLAACSGSGDVVATVNGVDILESEVLAFRTAESDDVRDAAEFREDLSLIIIREAVASRLESDYGVAITSEMVEDDLEAQFEPFLEQLRSDAITELGDGATDAEIAAYVEDNLGEVAVQVLGTPDATGGLLRHVIFVRLITTLGPDAVLGDEVVYDQNSETLNQVCASHILVETQEEAQAAFGRLEAGEAFADLAAELSIDPGSAEVGGELGCTSPVGYVPEFAEATLVAPLGEPFGPFESQFGWHILLVSDRIEPTLDQYQAAPLDYLPPDDASSIWGNWVNFAVSDADVTVAARVGDWSPETQAIVAPGE
jgi:parvulin-like peptidyl-prolyl isomerase